MKPKITEHGIEIQTFEEVFEEYAEGYKEIYGQDIDLDQESPDGQRVGIDARVNIEFQQVAVGIRNSMDPDHDDGLMRMSKLSGVYLKPAAASQWDLKVTADKALLLRKGYTVEDELDQEWWLTGDVSLAPGENTVTFIAKEVGRVEGVQGSEIKPVTIVTDVISITADEPALIGRNEETPEELRQRRERSLQNPAHSVVGSLYAKLAQLDGVTDLQVVENDQEITDPVTGLPANSVWAIVEGGRVADIIEVIVKQKTAGAKTIGEIESTYPETLTKPNGDTFILNHNMRFDRPTYVDMYVTLEVHPKVPGDPIDAELIKQRLADTRIDINQPLQAGELYDHALQAGDDFVVTEIQISVDDVVYTDGMIAPAVNERFIIDAENVTVIT